MKTLTLTDTQFEVLFDIIADTVDVIEDDLITTEDENGNEILEDISEYEAHKIYKQMIITWIINMIYKNEFLNINYIITYNNNNNIYLFFIILKNTL